MRTTIPARNPFFTRVSTAVCSILQPMPGLESCSRSWSRTTVGMRPDSTIPMGASI